MTTAEIAKLPTKRTDAIRNTPLMGETVTTHKWDEMTDHARRLEQKLAAAVMALESHLHRLDVDAQETLAAIKEAG